MKLMDTSHIDVLGLMCSFYYTCSCSKIEYNNTTVTVVVNTMNAPNIMHMCMGTRTQYTRFSFSGNIIAICNMYNTCIPKRT